MPDKVLSVGQCAADHAGIRHLLEAQFGAEVLAAHSLGEALSILRRDGPFRLVLVNRRLDADYSDGLDVLQAIKDDDALAATPVMMVTNFPEHQDRAVQAGAVRGFGKAALRSPQTMEVLRPFLTD